MQVVEKHRIYDSVHGFIRFNDWERAIIDSRAFQRLRNISQMGISYLIYPGATHKRFEHSLGVLELAGQVFDNLMKKVDRQAFPPGVIPEQERELFYWRAILRFAALCHDLGHLPFSHTAEEVLLGSHGHERMTAELIRREEQLGQIWRDFGKAYQRDVAGDVLKIALGPRKLTEMGEKIELSPWEKILAEIITGDYFGVDRIDYLLRDARCTGVLLGFFDYHQLLDSLLILQHNLEGVAKVSLGLLEEGLQAVEGLLFARYLMHLRVYKLLTAKIYDHHLAKFMEIVYHSNKKSYFQEIQRFLKFTDNEVLVELSKALEEPNHPGHQEAKRLLIRGKSFKPLEIAPPKEGFTERLSELQTMFKDDFFYDKGNFKSSKERQSFPILMSRGVIQSSSAASKLMEIPAVKRHFIFIAPERYHEMQAKLLAAGMLSSK